MTDRSTRLALLFSTLTICLAAAAAGAARPEAERALADLAATAGGPITSSISPATGLATFVSVPAGTSLPSGLGASAPAEARARAFLLDHGAAFGLDRTAELALRRQSGVDRSGFEHLRFRQSYRGVPVAGGEIGVHLDHQGVTAVHAKLVSNLAGVSTTPTIGADEALQIVRRALAGQLPEKGTLSRPRLELLNRGLLEGRLTPTRLTWFVEARATALREYVWVDATTATIALRFSQLARALDREVYDAEDGSTLPGTLRCSEGDPPTGDADVDDAYAHSGDTWTYFFSEHGRDSYDGTGATLVSTVGFCPDGGPCPYPNAFWNGNQMVYGDGYPAADDVAAHELTHAVIEQTADLFYYMQSGALSESYADVFGEAVDLGNGTGNDASEVRWLLGEDLPGGATRSMMDPPLFADPAWMSDWRFVCEDPGADGGGVHSNCGVPNHAFALLVDGGDFNGFTITGIGLSKAAAVYYRALTDYLLSASNFTDNDDALRRSCLDLVVALEVDAGDCDELGKALDAVEMDQPWCQDTEVTAGLLCPSAEIASTLFSDDLESGTGNWATTTISGVNVWAQGHDFASSGTSHLWGDLRPQCGASGDLTTDSSVELIIDVALPLTGAYLTFDHAFGFENYSELESEDFYDGGVLEYSIDGGSGWSDAGAMIVAGTPYGGAIDDRFGNPLGGRQGFVADSWGYTTSQLDLTGLAGESVRFRYRIGTDTSTDFCDYGWFVDDVRVFECPGGCLAMPASGCLGCAPALELMSGGPVATIEAWVGCDSIRAGGDFGVGSTGQVTLIAPGIILEEGFSVDAGGTLALRTD